MGISCGGASREQRFPNVEQIYEAHRQTKLPLVTMKIELERNMAKHMPLCQMEDLGGYKYLIKDELNGNTALLNHPKWRLAYIKLHNQAILEYVAAHRDRRIDPTYCSIRRQYTLEQFDIICKYYPEAQNFPLLLIVDRLCTKKYFLSSLCHGIILYIGVSDIACRLLVKFSRTLILCIKVFSKELLHN